MERLHQEIEEYLRQTRVQKNEPSTEYHFRWRSQEGFCLAAITSWAAMMVASIAFVTGVLIKYHFESPEEIIDRLTRANQNTHCDRTSESYRPFCIREIQQREIEIDRLRTLIIPTPSPTIDFRR